MAAGDIVQVLAANAKAVTVDVPWSSNPPQSSGHLLIMAAGTRGNNTLATPSGWTLLASRSPWSGSSSTHIYIFGKISATSEMDVTFNDGNVNGAMFAYGIEIEAPWPAIGDIVDVIRQAESTVNGATGLAAGATGTLSQADNVVYSLVAMRTDGTTDSNPGSHAISSGLSVLTSDINGLYTFNLAAFHAAGTVSSTASVNPAHTWDESTSLLAVAITIVLKLDVSADASGSLVAVLDSAVLSSSGAVAVIGQVVATLDDAALDGDAELAVVGVATATLGAAAVTAVGAGLVAGSGYVALDDTYLASLGATVVVGATAATLDDSTLLAAGAAAVAGQVAAALDDATTAAFGAVEGGSSGATTETLDDAGLSATGIVLAAGALVNELGDASLVATGALQAVGIAVITLDDVEVASVGNVTSAQGTVAKTLAEAALDASGAVQARGATSVVLADVSLIAVGRLDAVSLLVSALVNVRVRASADASIRARATDAAAMRAAASAEVIL